MATPVLETPRLILRPICLEDAPRVQELFPYWEIVQYMAATIPWPYPDDGAEYFIREVALPAMAIGEEYYWSIAERSDPESKLIGLISLSPKSEYNRGFWIGQAYQKRGYMTEAVIAINDFAFDTLGMDKLILNNAEPNIASHRIKEVSGARIERTIPEHPYIGGQKLTQIRWLLTREAWQANRHKLIKPAPI
jgi:RimJ/RimL family protein N-acetyltransferase